ncbi:hypothetical protein ACZ90_08395 [Streptomyces albus subsp. albus]|nr:hypothetical protein ACZ90_08395 [Streptomyces albus subsp. albus]
MVGIESDRLVYDYLSQVGDLAQQWGLPSRDRMRLVATLRSEIDQQRAAAGSGGRSEAGVKRILGRLGTPAEVVTQASAESGANGGGPAEPPAYGRDAAGPGPSGGSSGTGRGADPGARGGAGAGAGAGTGSAAGGLAGLGARLGAFGRVGRGRDGDTSRPAIGTPDPHAARRGAAGPAPGSREPGASAPGSDTSRPGASDASRSDASRSDTSRTGASDTSRSDTSRTGASDTSRSDASRSDAAEASRSGAAGSGSAVPASRPAGPEVPAPGAAGQGASAPGTPGESVPDPAAPQEASARKLTRTARERLAGFAERSGLTGKAVPGPRTGSQPPDGPDPDRPRAASPPHLAGEDELSIRESNPDWWRMDAGPFSQRSDTSYGAVEGFTGGIEIPELLKPPGSRDAAQDGAKGGTGQDAAGEQGAGAGPQADAGDGGRGARRGLLRRVVRRRAKAEGAGGGAGISPMLLLSIVLLTAGALLGNVILPAFGWVIAYYLGKLSPAEAKTAVLVLPGLVAGGAMVWVWGRLDGRWGEPIPEHGLGGVVRGTWPVVIRAAAVVSVLFLLWRARRRRG